MLVYPIGIQTLRNTACCRIFQMQVFHECLTSPQSWNGRVFVQIIFWGTDEGICKKKSNKGVFGIQINAEANASIVKIVYDQ